MLKFDTTGRVWIAAGAAVGLLIGGALVASRAIRHSEPAVAVKPPVQRSLREPSGRFGAQPSSRPPEDRAAPAAASAASEPEPNPQPNPKANPQPNSRPQPTALAETNEPSTTKPGGASESDAAAEPAAEPRDRGGLTGVSRRYDDLECQMIQRRYSTPVPATATILEVDGDRLPLANPSALALCRTALLFLPRGTHSVRFRPNESATTVTIRDDFQFEYDAMGDFFGHGPRIRTSELLSRGARVMDAYGTPFLLNFLGADYANQQHWDAAERTFRRALAVNPTFSPAHLNLCRCLLEREAREDAVREVNLADVFNVGNVFGLAQAIGQTRRKLGLPVGQLLPAELPDGAYRAVDPLTEEDRRMVSLLQSLANYAVREEDRGKILNNLGVHFADRGKPELALFHFRSALAAVKNAGPDRFTLGRQILLRMSDTCRKAGFVEADEYRTMSNLVSP
jgi:hypothetical protein